MELAENENLSIFSITDHDTVQGTELAEQLSNQFSFQYLAGIELSARYKGKKIEVLGYNFNTRNQNLKDKLNELQNARRDRITKILEKLRDIDIEVTLDEVLEEVGTAQSPGRPHFARTLVKKGYVKSVPEAFDKFLNEGKPAYVRRKTLDTKEAFKLVHQANGVAILPHPLYIEAYDMKKLETILDLLLSWNLEGIEVYYNYYHTGFNLSKKLMDKAIEFLKEYCKKNDLLVTGGTDFHGDSGILGDIPISDENIKLLLDYFS